MRKFYFRNRATGQLVGYVPTSEQIGDEREIDALNHGPQKRFAGWAIGLFLFFALLRHWAAFRLTVSHGAVLLLWGGGALLTLANLYEAWLKHARKQVPMTSLRPGFVRWAMQNRIRYWLRRPLLSYDPRKYSRASASGDSPLPAWVVAHNEWVERSQNASPAGPINSHSHVDSLISWAPSLTARWMLAVAIFMFLVWSDTRSGGAEKCDATTSPSPHCARLIENAARRRIYAATTPRGKLAIVEATAASMRAMQYPLASVAIVRYHLLRATASTEEYRAALHSRSRMRAGFPMDGHSTPAAGATHLPNSDSAEPPDSDHDGDANWDTVFASVQSDSAADPYSDLTQNSNAVPSSLDPEWTKECMAALETSPLRQTRRVRTGATRSPTPEESTWIATRIAQLTRLHPVLILRSGSSTDTLDCTDMNSSYR